MYNNSAPSSIVQVRIIHEHSTSNHHYCIVTIRIWQWNGKYRLWDNVLHEYENLLCWYAQFLPLFSDRYPTGMYYQSYIITQLDYCRWYEIVHRLCMIYIDSTWNKNQHMHNIFSICTSLSIAFLYEPIIYFTLCKGTDKRVCRWRTRNKTNSS